ncbi:MAG: ABC transporter permease, partial [Candidatus Schekmanbacteria bacterium]
MSIVASIIKKEMKSYFTSSVAYVILALFIVINGFIFFNFLSAFNLKIMQFLQVKAQNPQLGLEISMNEWIISPLLSNISIILLLLIPAISMRLISEEKRQGTMELLMTSPISTFQILMGKYLSCLIFYAIMLISSLQFPIFLKIFGNPDVAPAVFGYVMLFLLGAAFISVGLLASSLTENQIISASLSFAILLFFWLIGWTGNNVGGKIGEIISYFSLYMHFDNALKGVLDSKDIIY